MLKTETQILKQHAYNSTVSMIAYVPTVLIFLSGINPTD